MSRSSAARSGPSPINQPHTRCLLRAVSGSCTTCARARRKSPCAFSGRITPHRPTTRSVSAKPCSARSRRLSSGLQLSLNRAVSMPLWMTTSWRARRPCTCQWSAWAWQTNTSMSARRTRWRYSTMWRASLRDSGSVLWNTSTSRTWGPRRERARASQPYSRAYMLVQTSTSVRCASSWRARRRTAPQDSPCATSRQARPSARRCGAICGSRASSRFRAVSARR